MRKTSERVLFLLGSPKDPDRSNAARLGGLVVDGLEDCGWESEFVHLHRAVSSEEGTAALLRAVGRSDVMLFSAPLSVDSLPAPAIRALELIAARPRPADGRRPPRFVSIVHCGFLEPSQNDTCQRILSRFADQAGLEWVAGVSLGAGGRITKRIRQAFELLVDAIDLELLVPDTVDRLTRKPVMPRWLYIWGGNAMWKRWAERNGVKERLKERPYLR